jgi:hypothetical protein
MVELQERLSSDVEFGEAYRKAHASYIADRDALAASLGVAEVTEIAGISAGGMPTRVKCLHALVGHSLAAGAGVNLVGDIALEQCSWSPLVCACAY